MKIVRLALRTLLFLVVALVVVVGALIVQGRGLVTRTLANPVPEIRVTPDSALIARGRHLAEVSCEGCHSEDLGGGRENILSEASGPPLGVLYAPNLTPGGRLRDDSDGIVARAIREGVNRDGHALIVMPSAAFHSLSDRDLHGLIAFLRSLPPVEHETPARRLTLFADAVLGVRLFETSAQLPIEKPVPEPPADSSAEHGRYLVTLLTCSDCHGKDLKGGRKGQFPPIGPDLKAMVSSHDGAAFEQALRHGIGTGNRGLDPTRMPWPTFSHLTDTEVAAIYAHLKSDP